jgi:hypothetical protein
MAIGFNRFNPGQHKQRHPTATPNPRAAMLCDKWVKEHGSTANFDQLYRMLVENGFEPNKAHLALEDYMRKAMMKRVKPQVKP